MPTLSPAEKRYRKYLKIFVPKMEARVLGHWKKRSNALPKAILEESLSHGAATTDLRNIIRNDCENFVWQILAPFWESAFTIGGGKNPQAFALDSGVPMVTLYARQQMRAIDKCIPVLLEAHPDDADSAMLRTIYGLNTPQAVAVARYEANLVNKGLLGAVARYAASVLADRARKIVGYEAARSYSSGSRDAAKRGMVTEEITPKPVPEIDDRGDFVEETPEELKGDVWVSEDRDVVVSIPEYLNVPEIDRGKPGDIFWLDDPTIRDAIFNDPQYGGQDLIYKVWHTDPDSPKICKDCESVDGDELELDEYFYPITPGMYPVQQEPMHDNCYCTVEYVRGGF